MSWMLLHGFFADVLETLLGLRLRVCFCPDYKWDWLLHTHPTHRVTIQGAVSMNVIAREDALHAAVHNTA